MTETFPPAQELLPHRGPAVLIERVLENKPDSILVLARVDRGHPYFVPGLGVPAWVGIELMAQASAAHAGLEARREQRSPNVGMLLGTRRYQAHVPYFPEGAPLEIYAERGFGGAGGFAACNCIIRGHGQVLVEASIILVELDGEKLP